MPSDGVAVTRKQKLAAEIARAVGAGRAVQVDTVDFSDPERPRTCLEVDFPILAINQIAQIEGNAGKPIYQMSKWWARRRSSVFRAILLAAATRAPDDPAHAAKAVWDVYYANHQKKGALQHLKVADIFMGGGTTLVEGSRLGMQMSGVDLNPVAWFVVKQEFAKPDLDDVKRLLAEIESKVRPQIMPFYACEGPGGERGTWTRLVDGEVMGRHFEPLALAPEEREGYRYDGPEVLHTFWAKHGPCQVTGCGHRTPIMTSNVMATKTLMVKRWPHTCSGCRKEFEINSAPARMAPDVPLILAPGESAFAVLRSDGRAVCPYCSNAALVKTRGKGESKKVELSLLVHPAWLAGAPKSDKRLPYGGSAQDEPESTTRWDKVRASTAKLLEVRGALPEEVTCPDTGAVILTGKAGGTVPRKSAYACAACGTVQDVLTTVKASGKTGPMAGYAIQGYAPSLAAGGAAYNGRFFAAFDAGAARRYDAAAAEWETRKNTDLAAWWPRSEVPFGFMTAVANGDIRTGHGFTHWWTMFNPRQLLVHALLLRAIMTSGTHDWSTREYVLGAFQQYLRNQCMFSFWHVAKDHYAPALSNNNFHPKSTIVEVGVFASIGYGLWRSASEPIVEGANWMTDPWECVSINHLRRSHPALAGEGSGKSEKVRPSDRMNGADIDQGSATDLAKHKDASIDLVVTDPPFGGLLHYSELSDFFYVWLRLALEERYPEQFGPDYTPKTLEAVANSARQGSDAEADAFYQRLLTQAWREAHRILKPGGILAFTFHHSEDAPWIAVLESLFDAGFYLEATYPVRSDETKGDGEFGSKKIEYDIVHVCRKRTEEPKPVSWARMRREVLAEVRQLQGLLEAHAKEGLPAADLAVVRRGKALEYFSRHYGQVYVDHGRAITVQEALVGINQIIDEMANRGPEPPPVEAEPFTRQFLRIFADAAEQPRDQMQKYLRGSGTAPEEFVVRGWCRGNQKAFQAVSPLELAQAWHGRRKRKLTSDYDQAMVLIGACFAGSGISAADTLRNENFESHPALKALLDWHARRGQTEEIRDAARRAAALHAAWERTRPPPTGRQMSLFDEAA